MPIHKTLLAVVAVMAAVVLFSPPEANAFNNEPNGWGQLKWGTSVESAIKGNPTWRKTYNLRQVSQVIKTKDVILKSNAELDGKTAVAQWIFGQRGLHTVVLSWEDTRAEAYSAYKEVLKDLEIDWGPANKSPSGDMNWEGDWSKVQARRLRIASGSGVEVRLTATDKALEGTSAPPPSTGSKRPAKGDTTEKKPVFDIGEGDDLLD